MPNGILSILTGALSATSSLIHTVVFGENNRKKAIIDGIIQFLPRIAISALNVALIPAYTPPSVKAIVPTGVKYLLSVSKIIATALNTLISKSPPP